MRTTFLKEMLKAELQVAAAKRKSNCTCQIEIDVYEQFNLLELLANYQEIGMKKASGNQSKNPGKNKIKRVPTYVVITRASK